VRRRERAYRWQHWWASRKSSSEWCTSSGRATPLTAFDRAAPSRWDGPQGSTLVSRFLCLGRTGLVATGFDLLRPACHRISAEALWAGACVSGLSLKQCVRSRWWQHQWLNDARRYLAVEVVFGAGFVRSATTCGDSLLSQRSFARGRSAGQLAGLIRTSGLSRCEAQQLAPSA